MTYFEHKIKLELFIFKVQLSSNTNDECFMTSVQTFHESGKIEMNDYYTICYDKKTLYSYFILS